MAKFPDSHPNITHQLVRPENGGGHPLSAVQAVAGTVIWTLPTPLNGSSQIRCHHLFKTFCAGPAGWTEQQLPDGTIVWTSPRGPTYTTQPLGARFFPQLAVPTQKLVLPNSPPPGPNRELAMPKRKRSRAQDRASRIQWERGLNQARYEADPPP